MKIQTIFRQGSIFIISVLLVSLIGNTINSYATQLKINSGQLILDNAVLNVNPRYPNFVAQWLQTKDDWVNGGGISGEYTAEEAIWTTVTGSPFSGFDEINYSGESYTLNLFSGAVKRDERTGLWWSDVAARSGPVIATSTNDFDPVTDGNRPTGGYAIGFCDALNAVSFAGYDNWYLPTQKELMQAYIDGSARISAWSDN